jgi:hypothetical protein
VTGKCLAFDGTTDHVALGNVLNMGTSNFTISAWVNSRSAASGNNNGIVYKRGTGYAYSEGYRLNMPNGQFNFHIADGTNSQTLTVGSSGQYNDGKWHYVVAVATRGSEMRIYVDGVSRGSVSETNVGNIDTATVLGVGALMGGYHFFTGKIDEPKIYNYARSAAQIKLDYNAGLAGTGGVEGTSVSMGGKSQKWLTDGLVGHWKMDEASWAGTSGEVIDASGNGNNGTATNGAITAVGKFGNGGSFDGTDDVVLVSDTNNSLDMANDFTVSFWVNPTSSGTKELVAKAAQGNYEIWQSSTNLSVRVNGSTPVISASSIFTYGQWTYVTVKYERSLGLVTIYQNGSYFTNGNNTNAASINNSALQIGAYSDGTSYPFLGKLDELRIYNRALSPDEIVDLYNYAPGPVGYWKMDENTGQYAYDTSGDNNNGTLGANSSPDTDDPTWDNGKFGAGLKFDGNNDYVNAGNGANLNITGAITVEAWIKPISLAASSGDFVSKYQNGTGGFSFTRYQDDALFFINDGNNYLYAHGVFSENEWVHIAYTADNSISGSTNIKAYIDGVYWSGTTRSINMSTTTNNLYIGGKGHYNSYNNGLIDDVKIYNYARTAKQIVEDMNGGHPAGGSPVGSQVGYWKFDEGYGGTANNSGNAGAVLNGTITGATWSNDGKFGKALYFDGASSYAEVPNSTSLNPTGQISLSAWIKPISSGMGQYAVVVAKPIGAWATGGYGLTRDASTDNLAFWINVYTNKVTIPFAYNEWQYVAATYDGATMKIFKNGSLVDSKSYSTAITQGTEVLRIGKPITYNYPYKGYIDEVKIYNFSLTAEEIALDYNQGKSMQLGSSGTTATGTASNSADRAYCPPGDTTAACAPIYEWKMDENTGITVNDSSGSGKIGTMTNGPIWTVNKSGGPAIGFDGSDDFIELNSNVTLQNTNWTVSAWSKTGAAEGSILGNKSGGPAYNAFQISSSKISYFHYNGSWTREYGTSNIADNRWHHLTWANNGTTQMVDLYVDGKWEANVSSSIVGGAGLLDAIGKYWGGTMFLNGSMDNLRIYNYKRTPEQIAWDYNRGAPVGWWKMDEGEGISAKDSSGNNNTGTLTNMDGATDWVAGKINTALDFDGSNDYVTCGSGASLQLAKNGSVCMWFKSAAAFSGNTGTQKHIMGGGPREFYFSASSSYLHYFLSDDSTGVGSNSGSWDTNWHHVCATADGTTLRMYIDGVAQTATASIGANNFFGNTGALTINKSSSPFAGLMDDVRVYNYGLTPLQVKDIYNNGAVGFK